MNKEEIESALRRELKDGFDYVTVHTNCATAVVTLKSEFNITFAALDAVSRALRTKRIDLCHSPEMRYSSYTHDSENNELWVYDIGSLVT